MTDSAALTYDEVGATSGVMPQGFRHIERSVRLGVDWEVARREVMTWGIKTRSGFRVERDRDGEVRAGDDVLLRIGPIAEPVRVVLTIDEPDRRGFAYGTLAGHPLAGEESFIVSRRDGAVWLDIRSFSRPAGAWRFAALPLRAAQAIAHARYLRALA